MNLHAQVSGVIARVNPMQPVTIRRSNGSTQNADFTRVPTYSTTTTIAQIQALTADDLEQLDGLNVQGEKLAIYVNGNLEGVNRADGTGGDLVTLPDSSVFLVVKIDEDWNRTAGWTRAFMARQVS